MIPSWVLGSILGIATFAAVVPFQGNATCRDGWHSSAIGRRGACSHHGGVDRPFPFAFIAGAVVGIFSGVKIAGIRSRRASRSDARPDPPSKNVAARYPHVAAPTPPAPPPVAQLSLPLDDLAHQTATAEGEARTRKYLQRYFKTREKPSSTKQPRRTKRNPKR
jgi:hypothetical protein